MDNILKLRKRLKSEKAVFLPLAAVVALGLFTFLFLLVGYTGRMKLAQSELRAKLDIACGDVAMEDNYLGRQEVFKTRIADLLVPGSLRYAVIERADLIMPTMPASGNFGFTPEDPTATPPTTGGVEPLSVPGCDICKIYRSVKAPAHANQYPINFWNDTRNAGNTVACDIKAKVKVDFMSPYLLSLLGGEDYDLSMKSVWWAPLRGAVPTYDPSDPIGTSPALTIAIGTEMFTTTFDKRFRFVDGPALDAFNPHKKQRLETWPHLSGDPSTLTTLPVLGGSGPIFPNVNLLSASQFMANPSLNGNLGNFSDTFSFNNKFNVAGKIPLPTELPTDRDSMLTACLNPLVLVRNSFLSTVVELASRHGQLRRMTEILHMNPMHRHKDFFEDGVKANHPTKIVGFGEDLTQSNYQLPYVFYHTGAENNEAPNVSTDPAFSWFRFLGFNRTHSATAATNGYLNPFESATSSLLWERNTDSYNARVHALIASQLRSCYDLYGPAPNGIPRRAAFQGFLRQGASYEPAIYEAQRNPETGAWLQPKNRASDEGNWDQRCQYTPCPESEAQLEMLNAAELVSILGSTQVCPYNYPTQDPAGPITPNSYIFNRTEPAVSASPCPLTYPPSFYGKGVLDSNLKVSSTDLPAELVPDILGTLNYILGLDDARAIRSPGIFPLRTAAGTNPLPFRAEDYHPMPENLTSSLLLVFHQPVRQADVKNLITARVSQIINRDLTRGLRPITVIYMPYTFQDSEAANDIISDFSFNGNPPFSDSIFFSSDGNGFTEPVVVYNFSPYDAFWGPLCGGPGDKNVDAFGTYTDPETKAEIHQSDVFRNYWNCLLTNETGNIVTQASRIFKDRILRRELKF